VVLVVGVCLALVWVFGVLVGGGCGWWLGGGVGVGCGLVCVWLLFVFFGWFVVLVWWFGWGVWCGGGGFVVGGGGPGLGPAFFKFLFFFIRAGAVLKKIFF
ncbi:hypothetical protein RA262_27815, partial [Pseudomonas syringae pv. tagetis]